MESQLVDGALRREVAKTTRWVQQLLPDWEIEYWKYVKAEDGGAEEENHNNQAVCELQGEKVLGWNQKLKEVAVQSSVVPRASSHCVHVQFHIESCSESLSGIPMQI